MEKRTHGAKKMRKLACSLGLIGLLMLFPASSMAENKESSPQLLAFISYQGQQPAQVSGLKLNFKHVSSDLVSFYNPADYPTVDYFHLANGVQAKFDRLQKAVLEKINTQEKVFIPQEQRQLYASGIIDKDGYNTVSRVAFQVTVTAKNGESLSEKLRTPAKYALWLQGETSLGKYEFNLMDIKAPLTIEFRAVSK